MKESNNIKLVFFGSSKHVIPIIQALKSAKSRFNLELVVTTEQSPADPVPHFCFKNKIDYLSVSDLSDPTLISHLSSLNSQIAVLGYFGLIIPQTVLKIFLKGIINIHPSLLPKYRGPTPVQNAILNGEKVTGVTLIKLDENVDHGSVLVAQKEKIDSDDTADSLYKRLFEIGADLIYQNIKQYIKGDLKLKKQDHSKATFTKLLQKNDGFINLDNPPSPVKIGRMIRAFYPWPGVFIKYKFDNKEKIIKLLPGQIIQVEGKNPMSYKDFINGYSEGNKILKKLNLPI